MNTELMKLVAQNINRTHQGAFQSFYGNCKVVWQKNKIHSYISHTTFDHSAIQTRPY